MTIPVLHVREVVGGQEEIVLLLTDGEGKPYRFVIYEHELRVEWPTLIANARGQRLAEISGETS